MYNDYNVIYESYTNEFIIPILVGIGIIFIIAIIFLIGLIKVFKKANRSGVAAIIPIYNFIVMLEIVNMPIWYLLLLLVPVLNIIIYFQVMFKIAKSFRKTTTFAMLTALFPTIFIPILGFSDSEYIGINKEAMMGTSIAPDFPIVKEEEIEATTPEKVRETKPMDISIGGGIYQQNYQQSLIDIPEENKKVEQLASFKVEQNQQPTQTFKEKEETGVDALKNIAFIESKENKEISDIIEPNNLVENNESNISSSFGNQSLNAAENPEIMAVEIPGIIHPTTNLINESTDTNSVNEESKNNNIVTSSIGDSNYISCLNCGSMIPEEASKCFMCGKER